MRDINLRQLISEAVNLRPMIGQDITEAMKDYDSAKPHIVPVLVSGADKEYISDKVHEDYLDLTIIYKVVIRDMSVTVTSSLLEVWGIDSSVLHRDAMKNLGEPAIKSAYETLCDMGCPMPTELAGEMAAIEGDTMTIITSKDGVNGARFLLDNELFGKVAERFSSRQIAIIPSSIHELIVMPVFDGDFKSIAAMVKEVNDTEVAPEEVLSYSVYTYEDGAVRVAI